MYTYLDVYLMLNIHRVQIFYALCLNICYINIFFALCLNICYINIFYALCLNICYLNVFEMQYFVARVIDNLLFNNSVFKFLKSRDVLLFVFIFYQRY